VVVVDDGSARGHEAFDAVRGNVDVVLVHEVNRGKGAALRTAFAWVRDNLPRAVGVVTVDGDGQHDPEDVRRVAEKLAEGGAGLVLGVRTFAGNVPFRSKLGNLWTRGLFRLLTGLAVSDTQTGLRGIPAVLLPRLLAIPGDRYEYEIRMLEDARRHPAPPIEVPVRTIYLGGNASSHYRPLRDTFRTQLALWGALLRRNYSA
jgi:glycosyltransferase involved in cell wall biosynthesis